MPEHAPLAIEAAGLVKTFGATRAVDGLDLRVRAGSVYGLLGPNAAAGEASAGGSVRLYPAQEHGVDGHDHRRGHERGPWGSGSRGEGGRKRRRRRAFARTNTDDSPIAAAPKAGERRTPSAG